MNISVWKLTVVRVIDVVDEFIIEWDGSSVGLGRLDQVPLSHCITIDRGKGEEEDLIKSPYLTASLLIERGKGEEEERGCDEEERDGFPFNLILDPYAIIDIRI
uniref:Uncharacterized protein n=1 Tax=Oryza rufipogon TaxID=4529 RepID=A0A0E0NV96_ORYRU